MAKTISNNSSSLPRAIILVPDGEGGINRLFGHLQRHHDDEVAAGPTLFHSTDKRRLKVVRFPWRLLCFLVVIWRGNYQVCHINLSVGGSTLRKIIYSGLCRLTGLPYIIHLHGGQYPKFYAGLPGPLRAVVKHFFAKAERVIVLGTTWRDFVTSKIGVDPARAIIVPNAVPGPATVGSHTRTESPHLLFLGNIGAPKGTPELLQALADRKTRELGWTATIAGGGAVNEFRTAVASAGLDTRINVPGWVGPKEVEALLARSEILVLPSHVENLPLSLLEGMAYGLCPIVTPVGAVPDAIRDGENGVLVPVNDAPALGKALARLISDKDLRVRLSANARRDFKAHYDIRNYRKKLEAVYREACRG